MKKKKKKKKKKAVRTTTPDGQARAEGDTTPEVAARAGESASPVILTRAEDDTSSDNRTRADSTTTPVPHARAKRPVKPKAATRARAVATPVADARADEGTPSDQPTRADQATPPDVQTRTPQQSRLALKKKVRMFYDLQRLRLQHAGRTYKRPEGVAIDLHEVDVVILERRTKELHLAEKAALHDVEDHLKTMPFYVQVLSDKSIYKGIGPTMAGVILAEFDIVREDTPSKMWAFAGLRPLAALRCPKCYVVVGTPADRGEDEHLHFHPKSKCPNTERYLTENQCVQSGKAQRPVAGEKLNYNAWLRTKLVGVLGPVLIKVDSPWRKLYDDYKHRKQTAGWGKNDGHRHQAAIRFMVKQLLADIWRRWRAFEGLPVREPYCVEFQGKMPHGAVGFTTPDANARAVPLALPDDAARADLHATPEYHTRAGNSTPPVVQTRAKKMATPEPPSRADQPGVIFDQEIDAEAELALK